MPNEIEKTKFREMTVEEAIPKIAKILLKCQEEMKRQKKVLEIFNGYLETSSKSIMNKGH